MQIMFINNDGAGFADHIEIADGTTVEQLFAARIPHGHPQDYLIRVNRQPTTADYVLQSGDRVSITPTKIEGAACTSLQLPGRPLHTPATVPQETADSNVPPITKGSAWEPANGSTACT